MRLFILSLCLLASSVHGQSALSDDASKPSLFNIYGNIYIYGFAKVSYKQPKVHIDFTQFNLDTHTTTDFTSTGLSINGIAQAGDNICLMYQEKDALIIQFFAKGVSNPIHVYRQRLSAGVHQVIGTSNKENAFTCINGSSLQVFNMTGDSVTTVAFPAKVPEYFEWLHFRGNLIMAMKEKGKDYQVMRFDLTSKAFFPELTLSKDPEGRQLEVIHLTQEPTSKPYITGRVFKKAAAPVPLIHGQQLTVEQMAAGRYEGVFTTRWNDNGDQKGWKSEFNYWKSSPDSILYPVTGFMDYKGSVIFAGLTIVKDKQQYSFVDPFVITTDRQGKLKSRDFVETIHKKTTGQTAAFKFQYQSFAELPAAGERMYLLVNDQEKARVFNFIERRVMKVANVASADPNIHREFITAAYDDILIRDEYRKENCYKFSLQKFESL